MGGMGYFREDWLMVLLGLAMAVGELTSDLWAGPTVCSS